MRSSNNPAAQDAGMPRTKFGSLPYLCLIFIPICASSSLIITQRICMDFSIDNEDDVSPATIGRAAEATTEASPPYQSQPLPNEAAYSDNNTPSPAELNVPCRHYTD